VLKCTEIYKLWQHAFILTDIRLVQTILLN